MSNRYRQATQRSGSWTVRALGLAVFVACLAVPRFVSAAERIALLIANEDYDPNVGRLTNPRNDIKLVEVALRRVGFRVWSVTDTSHTNLTISIREHIQRVNEAGRDTVSFVYYAGHGAADEAGINYLIPVDVKTADTTSVWKRSVELKADLVDKLAGHAPSAAHYVVFDACRTELRLKSPGRPFEVGGKGFVPVNQASGVLIVYATAPNRTASDAGVYARILAEELTKPNVESITMFRNVQLRVSETIGQAPWIGELPALPRLFFGGRAGDLAVAASSPLVSPTITSGANLNDLFNDEFRRGMQALVANAGFKNLHNVAGEFIEAQDNRNIYKINLSLPGATGRLREMNAGSAAAIFTYRCDTSTVAWRLLERLRAETSQLLPSDWRLEKFETDWSIQQRWSTSKEPRDWGWLKLSGAEVVVEMTGSFAAR